MQYPYDENASVAPTINAIKRPAVLRYQQDDFETDKTFTYKEIFVEDRLNGVMNVYPKLPFNANYNAVCGSSTPPRIRWSNADYKNHEIGKQPNDEGAMDKPILDDSSICDSCLKRDCSKSQAYIMCFKCDGYFCENCECTHPGELKIKTTKSHGANAEVADSILESMVHCPDKDKEFNNIKVDIADKIFVKHDIDESDCCITGLCVLDDERIVVIDNSNSAVKIFRQNKLEQYLKLSTHPFDVTEMKRPSQNQVDKQPVDKQSADPHCKLAITCPAARMVLVLEMIPGKPIGKKCIRVDAVCLGIDYKNNCLLAVCKDPTRSDRLCIRKVLENGEPSNFDTNLSSTSLYAFVHVNSGTRFTSLSRIIGSLGLNCRDEGIVLTSRPIPSPKSCKAIEQNDSNKTITYTGFNHLNVSLTPYTHDKGYKLDSDSTMSHLGTEVCPKSCKPIEQIDSNKTITYTGFNHLNVSLTPYTHDKGYKLDSDSTMSHLGTEVCPKSCKPIEQIDSNKTSTYTGCKYLNVCLTPCSPDKRFKLDSDSTYSHLGSEICQQPLCTYGDTIYVSESNDYENRNFITVFKAI